MGTSQSAGCQMALRSRVWYLWGLIYIAKSSSVAAETRPEAAPSLVTFNTLMSACAKAGLYNRVGQLFRDLRERDITPDVYTLAALIQACRRRNFWEEAIEFTDTFRGVYGIRLNTICCNALISTLGCAGRWQYALQVKKGSVVQTLH